MSMGDNVDEMSCELISAGSDGNICLFNTAIVEIQSREMSQKPILKMLGMQIHKELCHSVRASTSARREPANEATWRHAYIATVC